MNYLNYIIKEKIKKTADIQINIPTFNGYEITKNTINELYKQINVNFDILLIDNASNDYEKLIIDFPEINYIVLKENTGSSGAQRIGAEKAIITKYKYIIFSDNDAILINNTAIYNMMIKFTSKNIVGIVPQNIELIKKGTNYSKNIKKLKGFFPLHYFMVRIDVFNNIELHNFYMFLSGDDASISSKLLSCGDVLISEDSLFYHPVFKPKNIQNKNIFFTIRSLLILIFLEKNINIKWKIRSFCFVAFLFFQTIIHSLIFLDFSYFKTLYLIFISLFSGYNNSLVLNNNIDKIPKNKFILEEINEDNLNELEKNKCKDIFKLINILFIKKYVFYYSNYYKKIFILN